MSGSNERHSISNPSKVQGPSDVFSSRNWFYKSPFEEVSLAEEEGPTTREESTKGEAVEEGVAEEGGADRGIDEAVVTEAWRAEREMALIETSQEATALTGVPEESRATLEA